MVCLLPAAWAQQAQPLEPLKPLPQWRLLDTRWDAGQRFLAQWAAWRADPARPRLLHYIALQVSAESAAAVRRAAADNGDAALQPLADTLQAQLWGLLPGLHRIALDGGQVLLTLCVGGDALEWLRQQAWTVDTIFFDGLSADKNADKNADNPQHTAKALARSAHRGTQLVALDADPTQAEWLQRSGFVWQPPQSAYSQPPRHATYQPHWQLRTTRKPTGAYVPPTPARCIVIGAGLAGAASAASLARRGWQVQVLDSAAAPASGASGLPVGLFAPHLSADDNLFARVSRSGVRALLQYCEYGDTGEASPALLQKGVDWQASGVLERRPADRLGLATNWMDGPGTDWCRPASAATLQAAGVPLDTSACWHARAGWVRPARLVAALLAQPGIEWRGHAHVAQIKQIKQIPQHPRLPGSDSAPVWHVLDAQGRTLAEAELIVLAAGPACNALLAAVEAVDASLPPLSPLPLQSVRGQLSWGLQDAQAVGLPPFPVNGGGGLVAHVPQPEGGLAWHMGSTFERDVDQLPLSPAEEAAAHATNQQRLQALLPGAALALQAAFAPTAVQAWAGVRCTAHDRLPIVGAINAAALPGLWVCTAMGARGLTRALLCGELLAAQLHGEPLPAEARLAQAMSVQRQ